MHSHNGSSTLWRRSLCPGSLRVEQGLSSDHTKYSTRGSRLHEAIFRHLSQQEQLELAPDEIEDIRIAWQIMMDLTHDTLLPGAPYEDGGATGRTKNGGTWYAEITLEVTAEGDSKDCGTPDLFIVYPERIVLIDWKFGASFIDHPKWNLQLQDYACSIWGFTQLAVPIEPIIIQPSAGPYGHNPWIYEVSDREGFINRLANIRRNSFHPDAPLVVGPACQFCKGREICSARAMVAGYVSLDREPLHATPEEINMTLWHLKTLKTQAESRIQKLKELIEAGAIIAKGWSIVQFGGSKPHTRLQPDKTNEGFKEEIMAAKNGSLYRVKMEDVEVYVIAKDKRYARSIALAYIFRDVPKRERSKRRTEVTLVKATEAISIRPHQVIA